MGKHKLVYCTKCGTKNEDTAALCAKCGVNLQTGAVESRRYERQLEDECFGLPHGGAIAGFVIGALIILGGLFALSQQQGWITSTPDLGWLILVIIGLLIVAGAIYRMNRRR